MARSPEDRLIDFYESKDRRGIECRIRGEVGYLTVTYWSDGRRQLQVRGTKGYKYGVRHYSVTGRAIDNGALEIKVGARYRPALDVLDAAGV